jgi:hypothetical protein
MPLTYLPPSRPNIYLPDGANTAYLNALKNIGTLPLDICYQGDSIFQGAFASNPLTTGVVGLLMPAIEAKYNLTRAAEYWSLSDSAFNWVGLAGIAPWVVNNAAPPNAFALVAGIGGTYGVRWTGGAGVTLATFTSPRACQTMDILYEQHYAAQHSTWHYQVDNGSVVAVDNVAPDSIVRRIRLTGLSNQPHTITFSDQSADNAVLLIGVVCYVNGVNTPGVRHARFTQQGLEAYNLYSGGLPSNANYSLASGQVNVSPVSFGFPAQCIVNITEYGVNDCSLPVSVANFSDAMQHIIDAHRWGASNSYEIIVIVSHPDPNSSDIVANNINNFAQWSQYANVLQQIARNNRCAIVDMRSRWGSTPVANGYLDSTGHGPHPTTAGHYDMAQAILSIL